MIVILEGPDGAGKTTLARQLQERYKLSYHHEGLPPRGVSTLEHYGAVLESFRGKDVVIDRFALGERVYGPVLRGEDTLGDWGWRLMQRLMQATCAFEVICLPPLQTCLESWRSGRPELFAEEDKFRVTYEGFEYYSFDDFIYDYTKPEDLKALYACLDLIWDAHRKKQDDMELPSGYIGRPNAKYLFVGDRGSNPNALHDLPFFATVGSSQYLNECIEEAGFTEPEIAMVNARVRVKENDAVFYQSRELKEFPQVIALGGIAAEYCELQKLRNVKVVPHPQYWKRFNYNNRAGYVELLQRCR